MKSKLRFCSQIQFIFDAILVKNSEEQIKGYNSNDDDEDDDDDYLFFYRFLDFSKIFIAKAFLSLCLSGVKFDYIEHCDF